VAYRPLRGVLRRGRVRARVVQLPARARRRRVLVEGYEEIARVVVVVVARGARRRRRRPRRVLLARAARARFSDRPRRRGGHGRIDRRAGDAAVGAEAREYETRAGEASDRAVIPRPRRRDGVDPHRLDRARGRGPGRALPGDDHRDPAVRPRLGRRRVLRGGLRRGLAERRAVGGRPEGHVHGRVDVVQRLRDRHPGSERDRDSDDGAARDRRVRRLRRRAWAYLRVSGARRGDEAGRWGRRVSEGLRSTILSISTRF
ncbi:uncharacterized protein MICPUCDRAFT_46563, partial [Micromonas pusilla CCMP1545]